MWFVPKGKLPQQIGLKARDISGIVVLGDIKGDVVQYASNHATDLTLPGPNFGRTRRSFLG